MNNIPSWKISLCIFALAGVVILMVSSETIPSTYIIVLPLGIGVFLVFARRAQYVLVFTPSQPAFDCVSKLPNADVSVYTTKVISIYGSAFPVEKVKGVYIKWASGYSQRYDVVAIRVTGRWISYKINFSRDYASKGAKEFIEALKRDLQGTAP